MKLHFQPNCIASCSNSAPRLVDPIAKSTIENLKQKQE
jgi:hypothetical protein